MNEKTCCVTGHRSLPAEKMAYVRARLEEEIEQAIGDGFTTFITGMAEGVDLLFAELVIAQKVGHLHLLLEGAIPYRGRLKSRSEHFQTCLAGCNSIKVQREEYRSDCYQSRNCYMVDQSSRVIAIYDGREKGGTLSTLRYAHKIGREVREIGV